MIPSSSMNGLDTCLASNPEPEPEEEEKSEEEQSSELSLAQIENICANMEGYW